MPAQNSLYYRLHWEYEAWWAKVLLALLALGKFLMTVWFRPVSALVGFTSTNYSIAGTAAKMLERPRMIIGDCAWAVLLVYCTACAFVGAHICGIFFRRFLSANAADVVSTVLLRFGSYKWARLVADAGGIKKDARGHTWAFLVLTHMDASLRGVDSVGIPFWCHSGLRNVIMFARRSENGPDHEARQAARIYNRVSDFLERKGWSLESAKEFRERARAINERLHVRDQLLKHP